MRDDVPARPAAIAVSLWVVGLLAFRRAHPFFVFCAAFGVVVVVDIAVFVAGAHWDGLYVNTAILLLPWSLCRWGSGREALVGSGVLVVVYLTSLATGGMKDVADGIGAAVVMALPAALGASARFRAAAQARDLETARARERERLARDLHDTVAHHVSAMVIQAQAGRLVGRARPDVGEAAFAAIEAEGARALKELRSLVGILREGSVPLGTHGLKDIEALARTLDDGRVIETAVAGDLAPLGATFQATLFRVAQEGVTNALRHAQNATRISVCVDGDDEEVRVCIDDDGDGDPVIAAGYGIAGMAERARLVGGTLTAGPRAGGGWRVLAILPRASP